MSVKAKFKVVSILHSDAGKNNTHATIKMSASIHGEDNKSWSKWTPSGELTMTITNPEAVEQLKVGCEYYLEFTPVPETV